MTSIGKKEEKDYVQIAIKKYIADRKTGGASTAKAVGVPLSILQGGVL